MAYSPPKILIVNQRADFRKMILRELQEHNYTVMEASTAEAALVMDDSQMARRISAEPLRRKGLTVFECTDGDDAFGFMEKMHKKIDIVITDLRMPKMGGGTLCLKLHRDSGLTDLLMCDIDHFKRVNERYGHTVGDEVLKAIVACLMGCIRADIDGVVRFGGGEFLIVLPETGVGGAREIGERLRRAVEEPPLNTRGDALFITASFGGTGFGPGEPPRLLTVRNLLVTADNVLYSSKNNGRNRVTIGALIDTDAES